MSNHSPAYLGVDGGGTKTTVVIVDAFGTEIARSTAPTSNPSVIGIEAASRVVFDGISAAESMLPAGFEVLSGWVGLSGFGRPEDHQALRPILERLIPEIHMGNDIELVLAGLPNAVGIALISGTGSIVAGSNSEGTFVRVGGWGHVFGDEGSGYAIGRDALKAIARSIDGLGPETTLNQLILGELGIDHSRPFDLISRIYAPSMDKAGIASLAKFPLDQAHSGDAVSLRIVQNAANDLADMATTAARRLGFVDRLPVALTGGNLLHILILRNLVLARLQETWHVVEPVIVIDPALSAARSLAGVVEIPE
ncbi:MAG: BadF/BadG/BcrA/BcrD ATPase family protein [Thermomicrobiales bacterium]